MRDAMLTASWQAGGLAVIVWLLTTFDGRWIGARWRCVLWSLVFIRLLLPALPPSPLSVLNVHPPALTETPKLVNATPDEVVTFGVGPDAAPPRAASAVVSAAPRIDWSACLLIIWLIVAAMLILRMTFAYWRLVMRLRRLTPTNDPRVVELLGGSTVRAFETNLVTSPAIVGVAIRTAWQRSDFLPETDRPEASALLRKYVDDRVQFAQAGSLDPQRVKTILADTQRIQNQLWSMAVANARKDMNSDVAALYIDSLN